MEAGVPALLVSEPDEITTFIFLRGREREPAAEFISSLSVHYNYRSWESLLDLTHICLASVWSRRYVCPR